MKRNQFTLQKTNYLPLFKVLGNKPAFHIICSIAKPFSQTAKCEEIQNFKQITTITQLDQKFKK